MPLENIFDDRNTLPRISSAAFNALIADIMLLTLTQT